MFSHFPAFAFICCQFKDELGESFHVAGFEQVAVDPVLDQVRDAADVGADGRLLKRAPSSTEYAKLSLIEVSTLMSMLLISSLGIILPPRKNTVSLKGPVPRPVTPAFSVSRRPDDELDLPVAGFYYMRGSDYGLYVLDRVEPCRDTDQDLVILISSPFFLRKLSLEYCTAGGEKSMPL